MKKDDTAEKTEVIRAVWWKRELRRDELQKAKPIRNWNDVIREERHMYKK